MNQLAAPVEFTMIKEVLETFLEATGIQIILPATTIQ